MENHFAAPSALSLNGKPLLQQRVEADQLTGQSAPSKCAWIGRNTILWPLFQRRSNGVMEGIFGEIEITQEPDKRGEHAPGFSTENGVYRGPSPSDRNITQCCHDQRVYRFNGLLCIQERQESSQDLVRARE